MTTPGAARNRNRRATRPSGDDRELAILTTLEELLEQRAFGEISVDDLAKGAGLSRPTFYFYFASKDAVLQRLFEQVMAAADATLNESSDLIPDDPVCGWREGIYAFFDALRPHRAVMLAGLAATATHPEIRQLWSAFMTNWIEHTAGLIAGERARGAAPETIPALDLATALNLMNERVMFASQGSEHPMLPEDAALETLAHIWITAIYGQTPTGPLSSAPLSQPASEQGP